VLRGPVEPVAGVGGSAGAAGGRDVDDDGGVSTVIAFSGIVFGVGVTNVALNVVQLLASVFGLAVCALYLRRLLAEWRREHGLRTALAEVHGMAKALDGNADLPVGVRTRLYAAMVEASGRALAQLDAGVLHQSEHPSEPDDALAPLPRTH
jgi:hypothetical protein